MRIDGITGYSGGQEQKISGGQVGRASSFLTPVAEATAGAAALTVAECAPGNLVRRTGPGAAYQDTTPTAAELTAAYPEINDGDSFEFSYASMVAFAATIAGGVGVTQVAGSTAVIAANSSGRIVLTKTSDAAWTFEVLV
jgi:hypothetical protein